MESQKNEYIFHSKLSNIDIPNNKTLHSYCFQNISQFNHRPCLIDAATATTLTYADVHASVSRTAAVLAGCLGVGKGTVVMLLLRNSPQFVFAFLGASVAGAATTAVNPAFTPTEIAKHAASSAAKVILTVSEYGDKVKDLAGVVNVTFVDSPEFAELMTSVDVDGYMGCDPEIDPRQDVVALPYSSGTTGLPKGVLVTHHALVTSVAQQVDGENPNLHMHSEDVILCMLPLFHIYALNSVLLCGLRVGAAVVLLAERFEVGRVLGIMEKYRVTVAPFVPPVVTAVVRYEDIGRFDLSAVRMVISGGAPMGTELEDAIREKLPKAVFGQGYGMTEGGCVSMCLGFAKKPFPVKTGSCGTIIRNAEMKIVDPITGFSLPKNQLGEICVRGPQILKGFLNDPEATKATIDEDGWLHSGDLGYVDDDDELFLIDRLKELIKYNGYQVAPAELEALLAAHPDINEAVVVPMKDEAAGEIPVAFVVRSNGSKISEDDIKTYISKQVVFYKRIRRVFFIDNVTKSPSGKIVRKELRSKLEAELVN